MGVRRQDGGNWEIVQLVRRVKAGWGRTEKGHLPPFQCTCAAGAGNTIVNGAVRLNDWLVGGLLEALGGGGSLPQQAAALLPALLSTSRSSAPHSCWPLLPATCPSWPLPCNLV